MTDVVNDVRRLSGLILGSFSWGVRIGLYYLMAIVVSVVYRIARILIQTPADVVAWFISVTDKLIVFLARMVTWPVDAVIRYMAYVINPPPPPKPVTVADVARSWADEVIGFLYSLPLLHVSIIASMVLVAWVLWRFLRHGLVRTVMRTRGVYVGESMREGSKFMAAKIPSGQVTIMRPGLLTDNHVGYGLRVGNALVVPSHVLSNLDNPILCYNGKKVMVSVVGKVMSRMMPDLEYIMFDDTTWTRIGVPKVRAMKDTPKISVSVSCTGMNGQSVGLLRKSTRQGLMVYMGSTIPGMSGAGYFVNGHCYGIHNGVLGNENVGISISLITRELRCLYRGETPTLEEQELVAQAPGRATKLKTWDDIALEKTIADVWGGDEDELEELEERWARNVQLSFNQESIPLVRQETVLTGQSPDEPQIVYRTTVEPAGLSDLENRVAKVENVIRELGVTKCSECTGLFVGVTLDQHKKIHKRHVCLQCSFVGKTAEILEAHVKETHVRYPCDHCGVVCRSELKLLNHRKECKVAPVESVEMKELTGESAFPSDHRKLVKTAPFLGVPKVQRKKNGKSSLNSSLPSTSNRPFPSQEETLYQILQSQKSMQVCFEKLQQSLAGLSSAIQPK